jgi:hypothetical protein
MPKMSKSAAMLCIAKAHALDGKPTDIPKRDWYLEIMERSGGSPSQFGKYIQTEDGKTLFAMYKSAKGKDYQGPQDDPDKEDDEDDDDPVNDPAYEKLADAARNLMKSNPTLSFPSAFAKAVNLHPALMKASTAVHRARIAKSYEPKPTVPRGEMGVQHSGLDQYRSMMEEAERLQLTGEPGSIAQIFSRLYQGKVNWSPVLMTTKAKINLLF